MERFSPPPSLLPVLDHVWVAQWTLPPGSSFPVDMVAMPCVNLVLARETAMVAGIKTERQRHMFGGCGRIVGLRFRPGGFSPFYLEPVSRIRNQEFPAEKLHPSLSDAWAQSLMSGSDVGATASAVFDAIGKLPVHHAPRTDLIEQVLEKCWQEPGLTIAAIAESCSMSVRTLEALFHDSVGVSLVWIRRQVRAISAMRSGNGKAGWAEIAQQLGYSDQAHMTNQFRQVVGVPPGVFFRRTQG